MAYTERDCERSEREPVETYHGLAWSPCGQFMAAGCRLASDAAVACLWRAATGRPYLRIKDDSLKSPVLNVNFQHRSKDVHPEDIVLLVLAESALVAYSVVNSPSRLHNQAASASVLSRYDFEGIPRTLFSTVSARNVAAIAHDKNTIRVVDWSNNPWIYSPYTPANTADTFAIAVCVVYDTTFIAFTSTTFPATVADHSMSEDRVPGLSAEEQHVTLTVMNDDDSETLTFHGIGLGGALAAAHTSHAYAVDSADDRLWIVTIEEGTRRVYVDGPRAGGGYAIRTVPGAEFVVGVTWTPDDSMLVYEREAYQDTDGIYVCSSADGATLRAFKNCRFLPLCFSPDATAAGVMENGDDGEHDTPAVVCLP